ncbi:hypothetical protein VTH06DRAFT_6975 [Thermothelomyces fergusii]
MCVRGIREEEARGDKTIHCCCQAPPDCGDPTAARVDTYLAKPLAVESHRLPTAADLKPRSSFRSFIRDKPSTPPPAHASDLDFRGGNHARNGRRRSPRSPHPPFPGHGPGCVNVVLDFLPREEGRTCSSRLEASLGSLNAQGERIDEGVFAWGERRCTYIYTTTQRTLE